MPYLVLAVLTVFSCILFEFSHLMDHVKDLIASYKHQFSVMSDKSISDEEKQKELFRQISRQLLLLVKLIFGIILFVLPFFSLYLLREIQPSLNPEILITWAGLIIPVVTVIIYILIKRNYGRIFGNR